jgi:hypothetical protein
MIKNKKSTIDLLYVKAFIKSMSRDYEKWRVYNSGNAWDGISTKYESPSYHGIKFKFTGDAGGFVGAVIDGDVKWEMPNSVLYNPFNKYFWKYHIMKYEMKKYISNEEKQDLYVYLLSRIIKME